ncbi:MAG: peptide deformylase [Kiritimatiellia bacterium]
MQYEVVKYGDPVLRRKADPVTVFDSGLKALALDMLRTMREANGVGLAAEQVGRTCALFVIDVPPDLDVEQEGGPRLNPFVSMPLIMANPRITEKAGEQTGDEGCLSFPAIYGPVKRAYEVSVAYQDLQGAAHTATVRGMLARAVQHEMDHLRGVLLIDHFSGPRKLSMALKLKRLKKATLEERKQSAPAS